MAKLNGTQIQGLAAKAGFKGEDLNIAVRVAQAESSGNTNAVGDGGQSIGLWQIHMPSHPQYSKSHLLNPQNNANAAFKIANSGRGWDNWTTYRNGAYQKQKGAGAMSDIPVVGDVQDAAVATQNLASTVRRLVAGLTDGRVWIRVFLVLGGILMLLAGISLIVADVGLNSGALNKISKVIPG